jgi:hypothetical protein
MFVGHLIWYQNILGIKLLILTNKTKHFLNSHPIWRAPLEWYISRVIYHMIGMSRMLMEFVNFIDFLESIVATAYYPHR